MEDCLQNVLDQPVSQAEFIFVMAIISIVSFGLLCFACYLIVKIYRLVKFKDMPLLLSIISIALALICLLIFSIIEIEDSSS